MDGQRKKGLTGDCLLFFFLLEDEQVFAGFRFVILETHLLEDVAGNAER